MKRDLFGCAQFEKSRLGSSCFLLPEGHEKVCLTLNHLHQEQIDVQSVTVTAYGIPAEKVSLSRRPRTSWCATALRRATQTHADEFV